MRREQTAATPHEIYIANIGRHSSGEQIDLRIVNQSEYRAWNQNLNGVKRRSQGAISGHFGVINLLGPRSAAQRPFDKFWNAHFTYVQLRYRFVNGATSAPLTIFRTYLTFYDFDTGAARFAKKADGASEACTQPPCACAAAGRGAVCQGS